MYSNLNQYALIVDPLKMSSGFCSRLMSLPRPVPDLSELVEATDVVKVEDAFLSGSLFKKNFKVCGCIDRKEKGYETSCTHIMPGKWPLGLA